MRATWQSVLAICADESSASDRRMRVRSDWSSARHASDGPSTARSYEIDCVATMGSGATGASARTSSRRSPARLRPPFVAQNTRARPTKGSSPCTRLRSIRDPQRLVPAARQRFRLTESVRKTLREVEVRSRSDPSASVLPTPMLLNARVCLGALFVRGERRTSVGFPFAIGGRKRGAAFLLPTKPLFFRHLRKRGGGESAR